MNSSLQSRRRLVTRKPAPPRVMRALGFVEIPATVAPAPLISICIATADLTEVQALRINGHWYEPSPFSARLDQDWSRLAP